MLIKCMVFIFVIINCILYKKKYKHLTKVIYRHKNTTALTMFFSFSYTLRNDDFVF